MQERLRPEAAWQAALGELEVSMGRSAYLTWLKSAHVLTYEDGLFVLGVANGYAKEWIEQRMLPEIKRLLSSRMGRTVDVRCVVAAQPLSASAARNTSRAETPELPTRVLAEAQGSPAPNAAASQSGVQEHYTFDAFVVGQGNRFAYAAAMAVAERPAMRYNPLFMYGGSGLGKTHLLHAIGNYVKQRSLVCCYVTSEMFNNELITAIRTQSQDAFRSKYRYVDVFLMDDVQFLSGKEFVQEELFHTFNALHSANKQVVLTSDRPPSLMVKLEDRLRSRFEWGLIVDIEPPDLETRVAILQHKAERMGREIPFDVAEFVAKQIQSNVRELEGALTRLFAMSEFTGRPVTLQLARDALSDLVSRRESITPSHIIQVVADYYRISVAELLSASRNKELVQPRHVAMYLLRQETDASLPEIGSMLGGRDHTTVLHGIERIKKRLELEEQLRRDLMSIRERLYATAVK